MQKVQVSLASGPTRLTCWVEPGVKVGNQITLKNSTEPHRYWTILSVSEPKETSEIHQKWDVGGL